MEDNDVQIVLTRRSPHLDVQRLHRMPCSESRIKVRKPSFAASLFLPWLRILGEKCTATRPQAGKMAKPDLQATKGGGVSSVRKLN